MRTLRTLVRFFVRIMVAFIPNKTKRHALRDAGFVKIDEIFDFPEHCQLRDEVLSASSGVTILAVTHDLLITGAPMALLAAIKLLLGQGFSIILISFKDGPLRVEFENLGVTVMVGRFYEFNSTVIRQISEGSDLILANTILCANWINNAATPPDRILWWLHESRQIEHMAEEYPQVYKSALMSAKNVYVVSDYARTFAAKYCTTEIIHLGIEDIFDQSSYLINSEPKLRIAVVGAFIPRKNQRLVLKALDLIPSSSLDQFEILFVGKPDTDYYKSVAAEAKPEWPLVFTGEIVEPIEKWRLFNSIDVFCVPSRDESCSLVVLEAFMMAKPVIISDRVGARYLLEDGKNGLIFQDDNEKELMNAIQWMISNRGQLETMGQNARQAYLKGATFQQFEDRFVHIVDSFLPDCNNAP